jgi:eukaryotic-like serine/threonine-protein kinase
MLVEPSDVSEREQRLSAIVLSCLEAVDSGKPLDSNELLARYPEFAAELTQFLEDHLHVDRHAAPLRAVGQQLGTAAADPVVAVAAGTPLGDFRLLREVGRGGMGIVYEAEQLSLGRRVALKILPFAATMDPRQLQRFQNEARAAASLEHPHIVPVYGVGCERGVHYYAMKFIDGQSLAAMISEVSMVARPESSKGVANLSKLPTPFEDSGRAAADGSDADATSPVAAISTERGPRDAAEFRRIAEWGIQAADALEHAHSVGIVHRDIKPANLMIDGHGGLWITDFGLARTAAHSGLTMTGDVLGTLRYMSPEQALAKHVDHRTDVYSLGMTLYELLTGRPAIGGKDREEILNAITLDEPCPPRVVDAAIPRDLETLVLRTIAKDPNERYGTARELADDLRRFLEDRPIIARRPGAWERIVKWARRHRSIARAMTAAIAVALVALVVSTILVWRAYESETLHRKSADENYRRAEEQRKEARQAVEDMYTQVAEKWLSRSGLTDVQHAFLQKALHYYERFAQDEGTEPALRAACAEANVRVGDIRLRLQREDTALEPFQKAAAIYGALLREAPNEPEYRHLLARRCLRRIALILAPKDYAQASSAIEQSIGLLERLHGDYPDSKPYRASLGACLQTSGMLLAQHGRVRESRVPFRRAIAVLEPLAVEKQPDVEGLRLLANSRSMLGESYLMEKRFSDSIPHLRASVRHWESLMLDKSGPPEYQHELQAWDWLLVSQAYGNVGDAMTHARDFQGATAAFDRQQAILQKLTDDFPKVPSYPQGLTFVHESRANLALATNQPREAEREYRLAISGTEKFLEDFPQIAAHRSYLARLLVRAPFAQLRDPRRAMAQAEQARRDLPEHPDVWAHLGMAQYQAGQWREAASSLQKSVQLSTGGETETCYYLAMTYAKLGNRTEAEKWRERAAASLRDEQNPQDSYLLGLKVEAEALLRLANSSSTAPKKEVLHQTNNAPCSTRHE